MKLCRIGSVGEEKPAIIDSEKNYRDLSSIINDLNLESLNFKKFLKNFLISYNFSLFFGWRNFCFKFI